MDLRCLFTYIFFFFNDTATTEIYTLSLHDALPISSRPVQGNLMKHLLLSVGLAVCPTLSVTQQPAPANLSLAEDRKSTRLNSSHSQISYAVFCLKKKKHTIESVVHIHDTLVPLRSH